MNKPSSDDLTTPVSELKDMVRQFVHERDWKQFHAPKNISMALAIEAAELMEHFQWISVAASRDIKDSPDKLALVADELADVLCYAMALANELDFDIATIMQSKMVKNRKKYPPDKFYGQFE